MATFVNTTLSKRTGATTTVFSVSTIANAIGSLFGPSSFVGLGPKLTLRSVRSAGARRTTIRITVPQVDGSGVIPIVGSKPSVELNLYIPDGTPSDVVNDLVGYMESALGTGKANLNAILVTGEGVY